MNVPLMLTRERVVASSGLLPAFPGIVTEILLTLDDPDANMNVLVRHIGRDPVIAARVFEQANVAASRTRGDARVCDLFTAASLVGMAKIRATAIYSCLLRFMAGKLSPRFWQHAAATGVCAQQLAVHLGQPTEQALVAGLLHDIGQLWMLRLYPELFLEVAEEAAMHACRIEEVERRCFGVDHATVGAWLAESWKLPSQICEAIRCHHDPDACLDIPLVAQTHVAEVLSNALDVGGIGGHVAFLSERACTVLGLKWDPSATALFGRIDAMSQFVLRVYRPEKLGVPA